jgi:filamin
MRVEALDQDLADGLSLVNLVEILTKKPIEKITKAPTKIIHKIQNCSLALKAIADAGVMQCGCSAEGNDDAPVITNHSDVVEGNLKMLLGLMWSLILHFQIMEDSKEKSKKDNAKESLMNWLKGYLTVNKYYTLL